MAANFITCSSFPELIVRIFQACESSTDVKSLASTCKNAYNVWLTNAPAIIWQIWPREIPAFEEALIAARATKLVVEAESRNDLPPMNMDLGQLSGHMTRPDIADLLAVLRLKHFAHAIEVSTYHDRSVKWPLDLEPMPPTDYPEPPERMVEWRNRLHKGVYRALIAGAALAGVYGEPIFKAKQEDSQELRDLAELDWPREVMQYEYPEGLVWGDRGLSEAQADYLRQFMVFVVENTHEVEENTFSFLAGWLLENILSDAEGRATHAQRFAQGIGRAKCCKLFQEDSTGSCPVELAAGGPDSDAHFVVWQLMQVLWVSERMEYATSHRITHFIPITPQTDWMKSSGLKEGEDVVRKISMVRFGHFQPEIVIMPDRFDLDRPPALSVHTSTPYAGTNIPEFAKGKEFEDRGISGVTSSNLVWLMRYMESRTGQPNYMRDEFDEGWYNASPLRFKFFEFFLRQHLNLRFDTNTFRDDWEEMHMYEDVTCCAALLAYDLDDRHGGESNEITDNEFIDGSEVLVSSRTPLDRKFQ